MKTRSFKQPKVNVVTLGCSKNLVDSEVLMGQLKAGGKYEVAAFARNITDTQRIIGAIDFNNLTGMVNEPRQFGVQFKGGF